MAKATLTSLADRLDRLADGLDDEVKDAKVDTAMAVVGYLAQITPVDTSRAISNWQGSVGTPSAPQRGPHSPGLRGSTKGASVAATIAAARAVFEAAPPNADLFISNDLPYIRPLDAGSSKQHPGGFVAKSVLVGRSILRRRVWFRGR